MYLCLYKTCKNLCFGIQKKIRKKKPKTARSFDELLDSVDELDGHPEFVVFLVQAVDDVRKEDAGGGDENFRSTQNRPIQTLDPIPRVRRQERQLVRLTRDDQRRRGKCEKRKGIINIKYYLSIEYFKYSGII